MKRQRFWIPLILVGAIVLQGLASPTGSFRTYQQVVVTDGDEEDDWDEDMPDFSLWSKDSLQQYSDSMLKLLQDSVEFDFIRVETNDTIQEKVDSVYREMFLADSLARAKSEFEKEFATWSKKEQKKWIYENVKLPAEMHRLDSINARKDSLKAIKDSIAEATPRILESPFVPDSLKYKRLLLMTQDKHFGDFKFHKQDTSYNAHYYDYPFFRQDVNATWQGNAGSAVQLYSAPKREEEENAIFFTPYRSWSYTPANLPIYNTKTPYTELGYWGTLLSGQDKEEINLRLLTTQNITPASNITFELNKYGGGGMMMKSTTANYNLALSTSYLGKRYSMHAGWLHDKLTKTENGGIRDNMWIRDTSVASREIEVNLAKAENIISRNTLFIHHNYRIPFGNDSLTTAFVGHQTEWNLYNKNYTDEISDEYGRKFYNNQFYINDRKSSDTLRTMRLDNKVYLRLQPWKADAPLSKIDVGIGDKLLSYHDVYNVPELYSRKLYQNSVYAYAGLRGKVKKYFDWDAGGQLFFAGAQAGDFNVDANMQFNFFPFRRNRNSPLSVGVHFHTDLTEPDHYQQQIYTNHYRWENHFAKESNTRISANLNIPAWRLDAEVTYSILANKIYYDTLGIVRQRSGAMNVLTASLRKDFTLWWFHFDNRLLLQFSSDQSVVPVPLLALNLRWYFQFPVVKNVLTMQLGANCLYNTLWQMPAFNPELSVFYNQNKEQYGNCPYFDVFLNMQWKRACIFIKCENVGEGAPCKVKDYFTAHNYIHTQRTVKFGIYWPFYVQPKHVHVHHHEDGHNHGHADGKGMTTSPGRSAQGRLSR